MADPIAFTAYLKQRDQPVFLGPCGGGFLSLDFGEDALDAVMDIYKHARGVPLYVVITAKPRAE